MRRILPLLLLLLLLFCLALPAHAERRVALVIGNSAYPVAPLKNPVNDARDMAAALRGMGFEVIARENASLAQMEGAVNEFWERLRKGGAGLFYFAGHGLQVNGRNYLVPIDARLAVEQDAKYKCMDAGLVLGRMENAGNGMNIIILDACRNNPFARSWRSADVGLAKMDAPKGSIIAYATAPDSVAADGAGKNGLYTEKLLKAMRVQGQPVEQMFKRVRDEVMRETKDKQVPWESTSLRGDFYFAGGTQTASLGPSSSPVYTPAPLPKISAPPKPGSGSVDLSDIDADAAARAKAEAAVKAEQARLDAAARKDWAARLKAMQADFARVQAVEKSGKYSADMKAKAWERFAGAYTGDNPYSDQDQTLRSKAQAQQVHWEAEARRLADAQAASLAAAQAKKQQMLAMAKTPNQPPNAGAPLKAPVGTSGQTWRDPATGMEFVWVPGGTFEMGCGSWTSECYSDEKPMHSVRLSGFWLGKFEVTQGQWQRVMGNNPSYFKNGDSYPVEQVSWDDAKEFISKLNAQVYAKFRLPTEAEWEYAARSGGKPEKYAGGNDVASVAWYGSNSGSSTHAVGTKAPNGLGLYDMSGNVWEWCEDVFASYSSSSQDDPVVTGGGSYRVFRGGCWDSEPRNVRSAVRDSIPSDNRRSYLGFRLARTN